MTTRNGRANVDNGCVHQIFEFLMLCTGENSWKKYGSFDKFIGLVGDYINYSL